jgi:hypothetical protein
MLHRSTAYIELQRWVYQPRGFIPNTAWLAHCKELFGLQLRQAPNRQERAPLQEVPI